MKNSSKTLWSCDNQDDIWLDKPLRLMQERKSTHPQSANYVSPNIKAFRHTQKHVITYKNSSDDVRSQTIKSLVKRNELLAREIGKLKELNRQQDEKIRELNSELLNRKVAARELSNLVSTSTSPFVFPPRKEFVDSEKKGSKTGKKGKENFAQLASNTNILSDNSKSPVKLLNDLMSLSTSTITDSCSPTTLFAEVKSPPITPTNSPQKTSVFDSKVSTESDLSPFDRPKSTLSSPPTTKRSAKHRRSSLMDHLLLLESSPNSAFKPNALRRSSLRASTGKIKSYREPSLRVKIRKGFQFFEPETLQNVS